MSRVTKIGNIVLDHKLWMAEDEKSTRVRTVARRTVGGGVVVFEQENRETAQYITLESRTDGWIHADTMRKVLLDAENSVGKTVVLTFDDGTTANVRYAHEASGGACKFTPLYDGSVWYRATINFGRIE